MAGAIKLFATTIDIRDVTKWKAERRHSWPEALDFRCGGAALSYRNRNARLLDALSPRRRSRPPGQRVARACGAFPRGELDTSISKPAVISKPCCRLLSERPCNSRAPKRAQQITFS
jgi:hypothetical protein